MGASTTDKYFLAALSAALLVAGCIPSSSPAMDSPGVRQIAKGPDWFAYKFCDAGRAVYVTDGSYSGAVFVIDNAPECSHRGSAEGVPEQVLCTKVVE